ncbi:expressed unknown protein [Seminavis robusta]|uniref:Uncharacterized protein n=1 Tax=Seminavis robusta TaxID=568900 RepID=A0A9N8HVL7_9STRA|nr:expressed unknown protein [Seminavis robusta]|eukprot:Sro2362_g324850.1 n/a (634) ;mRNA; r:3796-5777
MKFIQVLNLFFLAASVLADGEGDPERNRGFFRTPTTPEPTPSPTEAPASGAPSDGPTDSPSDSPTDVPSSAPTEGSSGEPTSVPSSAPTNAITDSPTRAPHPSGACIKTMDGSGKLCHSLMSDHEDAADEEEVATICVELVDDQLKATFEAVGDWYMVTNKFWFDDEVGTIPRLGDGSVDMESFPYFLCNSTGFKEWSFDADFEPIEYCDRLDVSSLQIAMVAYAEVEKPGRNGKMKRSTVQKVFAYEHSVGYGNTFLGWMDFEVDCECGKEEEKMCDTTPEIYLDSPISPACHAIVAGGADQQSVKAGEVCVAINDDGKLDVTFTADHKWTLLRSQLWVGQDTEDGNGLAAMPHKKSGAPDTRKFKNFACDWEGEKSVSFTIDLKYECIEEVEAVKFYVVAHSKVEQVTDTGELIPGTEQDVFAYEYSGDSEKWYGWFDFDIGCKCTLPPTQPPSSMPSELPSEMPSDQPSFFPTANYCDSMVADEDVDEVCYDMTATEAWESDAGTVCISVHDSTLHVTYSATNYWALFGTAVWWGTDAYSGHLTDQIPKIDGSETPDLDKFTAITEDIEGATVYSVKMPLQELECDRFNQTLITVVAQALVGEACIPPNGTYILGTDRNAFDTSTQAPSM